MIKNKALLTLDVDRDGIGGAKRRGAGEFTWVLRFAVVDGEPILPITFLCRHGPACNHKIAPGFNQCRLHAAGACGETRLFTLSRRRAVYAEQTDWARVCALTARAGAFFFRRARSSLVHISLHEQKMIYQGACLKMIAFGRLINSSLARALWLIGWQSGALILWRY